MLTRISAAIVILADLILLIALINDEPFQPLVLILLSNALMLGIAMTKET